jgi:quercetin dioxygenase-like cupin family protein
VERLSFAADAAFRPDEELLDGVTVAPLTSPLRTGGPVQAAVFRLEPNGKIACHPASVPQILAVLEGSGLVSGEDGEPQPINAGEAVFWSAGEVHETVSEEGLTALILEGDGLELFRR